MAKLTWDNIGEKIYETGVRNAVLYVHDGTQYGKGVAWNGITGITESPSGAEPTALYADDIKYLNIMSNEEFGASIEAYTYPEEFEQCDGSADLVQGVKLGQQKRSTFGLCYRTTVGNDVKNNDYGYKLHIIYGCLASPSEKAYATINDSPEAITFSWEVKTTPVSAGEGFKPVSCVTIDSTKVEDGVMKKIEDALYGTVDAEPTLLLPEAIKALVEG